jgi:hypothetical protein
MKGQVDSEDAILAPVFTLAAAASVGIADVTLFNTSITDTVFSLGSTGISYAVILGLAALGIAYITNESDLSKLDQEYYYAAIATPALMLGLEFMPALADFASGSDFIALGFVAVEAAGFIAISYLA